MKHLAASVMTVAAAAALLLPAQIACAVEPSPKVATSLIVANTTFGINLLKQLNSESKGGNVFISPVSVSLALSMVYNGAQGDTRVAMTNALSLIFPPPSTASEPLAVAQGKLLEELNKSNLALLKSLTAPDTGVTLDIANGLWARKGITFKPDFLAVNKLYYKAEVKDVDFSDAATIQTINSWVSRNTQGKIPTIVDSLSPRTIMFLANAVYFKGLWAEQFDSKLTKPAEFTLADGSKKQVQMMSKRAYYRYLEGDDFQAIDLPYKTGRMSMYIFLPAESSNLSAFLKKLNPNALAEWLPEFHSTLPKFRTTEIAVKLPRFKIEYKAQLEKALTALGMGVAFTDSADFSGITADTSTAIDSVIHKIYVEVNEEGTEAAAVTGITMRATSMPVSAPDFIVDRPFFLAIRDNKTGAILFSGAITDPTAG